MIDSGIGGLSYLKILQKKSPENEYILLMDKAFFPYGEKSKEFLIKRALYLCRILNRLGANKIILACNTLSLIAHPFLKDFFNVSGVFQTFLPYIHPDSVFIGSRQVAKLLKEQYPKHMILDGTTLIGEIQNHKDIHQTIDELNQACCGKKNLILACTHFLCLKEEDFDIPIIKNI